MARPTLFEIAQTLKCPPLAGSDSITGVATDSREVKPGQLFVALKGLKVDGHDYVDQAFANGAVGAIVRCDFNSKHTALLKVADPLLALQALARSHIAKSGAQVIAVTGSLGKTTTKEFLYTILKSKFKTACTSGNQNSQVGMAASLLSNVSGDEQFIVVEMGMTQAGHIKKLVDIVPPDKVLLTEIALVHAENFESLEAIAKAKAEIFSHPKTSLALISKDSACWEYLQKLATCKTMLYSLNDHKAAFSMEVGDSDLIFASHRVKAKLPFIKLAAPHVYLNLLAACSMASCCKMSNSEIGDALSSIVMPEKRLEIVSKGDICFINDSYNAAEQSMRAALTYMKQQPNFKRKIAVIGQMRELGRFSEQCHKAVGLHALDCVDKIYCLGHECAPIVEVCKQSSMPFEWFTDFTELVTALKNELQKNDLVLLKGSKSNGLWRVLDYFN